MSNPHDYIGVISAITTEELLLSETPGDSADKDLVRPGPKVGREQMLCRGSCFFHLKNKQG